MIKTNEGGVQYEHSLDHGVEFFSKAGSLFTNRQSFYDGEETALSLFQKVWIVDKELAFRLLLWLRDCRGGAGNRSAFREILTWISHRNPEWIETNLDWIPLVGRWDDLRSLFGTSLEPIVAKFWATNIKENILAAKWADRKDKPLRRYLQLNEASFRKLLAEIRKNNIVEHKMCQNDWHKIEYKSVPSVAMARYTNAFGKHDEERFNTYKALLSQGKEEIKAGVLFPHDCVRTSKHGDTKIANAQFDALPNFMEGTNEKIIVLADTSGSMTVPVSGSIRAMDISQGLALYCSSRMPKDGPFYKKFIGFESESEFKDWEGMTFSQAVRDRDIFDGACGATQIDTALDLILRTAKTFRLHDNQMPTMLLIVSDMQFHMGAMDGWGYDSDTKATVTEVDRALDRWKKEGYSIPKIVYWNTSGYQGSPDTVESKNIALVSGFSPAVLGAILKGTDFSPIGVMMKAIEKYKIKRP